MRHLDLSSPADRGPLVSGLRTYPPEQRNVKGACLSDSLHLGENGSLTVRGASADLRRVECPRMSAKLDPRVIGLVLAFPS